jgi:hypothetical protein
MSMLYATHTLLQVVREVPLRKLLEMINQDICNFYNDFSRRRRGKESPKPLGRIARYVKV